MRTKLLRRYSIGVMCAGSTFAGKGLVVKHSTNSITIMDRDNYLSLSRKAYNRVVNNIPVRAILKSVVAKNGYGSKVAKRILHNGVLSIEPVEAGGHLYLVISDEYKMKPRLDN